MVTIPRRLRTRSLLIMALAAALLAATLLALLGLRPVGAAAPATVPFQVLRNGGFEDPAKSAWQTTSNSVVYYDDFNPLAYLGYGWAVVYGTVDGVEPGLRQVVTIPPSTAATLTFFAQFMSCECSGSGEFVLRFTDGNGAAAERVISVGDSYEWQSKSIALGPYPSERVVTIEFASGDDYLTYQLDEISLVVDAINQPSLRAVPSSIFARSEYLQVEPITRTLRIEWIGGASANWTLSADQPWIGLPTLSGTDTMTVSVVILPAALGAGDHTGNVNISSPGLPVTTVPVHLAARGSTDVGVLRGEEHTCGANEEGYMKLDEDGDGTITGWQAGIGLNAHMWFVFCRVDGTRFKPFGVSSNPGNLPLDYAVLKLGHHCPDGSYEFQRNIDTEDGGKNYNESAGVWPNTSRHGVDGRDMDAVFHFCYFPGQVFAGAVPATHMSAFPEERVSYGVFAAPTHPAALDSGYANMNGERDNNKNSYTYAPDTTAEMQLGMRMLVTQRDPNVTVFRYIKAFGPTPPGSTACSAAPFLFCTTNRVVSQSPMIIDQGLVAPLFCPGTPRPIDLTISLHRRNPTAAERLHYDSIITHMADAVFEASNGVHVLRDVIFFTNDERFNTANLRWLGRGKPESTLSGYFQKFVPGSSIQMFDVFIDDAGRFIIDYMQAGNDRHAGYKLAHEMGHYLYGLRDENARPGTTDIAPPAPSIMNDQGNAIRLNNYQWLNFSSVNPGPNDQTRRYNASGWATLLSDPQREPDLIRGARRCFPELAWVDPRNGILVELPAQQNAARAQLNIRWWGSVVPPPTNIPLVDDQDVDTWPLIHDLHVDTDVDRLDITVDRHDPDHPPVTVIVRDPTDNEVKRTVCPDPANPRQKRCTITVPQPHPPGGWTVIVDNPNDADIDLKVDLVVTPDGETPIVAQVQAVGGPNLSYPRPLVLQASVERELPMTGVGIAAYAETPAGVRTPLAFVDDGTGPDRTAGDGLYTAELPYRENGDYFVHVAFDNATNTARYTSLLYEGGSVSDPVGVPFQRVATTFVIVSNVQQDDHADQCAAATLLTVNGAAYPGRIDRAGDVDFFAVQSSAVGEAVVRLTGLFGGMLPRLKIYDAVSGALIRSVQVEPTGGAYLMSLVNLPANRRLCLEVSHQNSASNTGDYRIEIGDELASEAGRELLLSVRGTPDGATVTDALDWEVLARVGASAAAGAGIQLVNVVVRGPDGEVVFQREMGAPAYCVLGEPPCAPWRFADHGMRWPNGAAVQDGRHVLAATAITGDGRAERVDRAVILDLTAPPPPPPVVYTISGRITLNGVGLAGVSVTAGGKRTTTDAQGNYTLSGLTAGTYTVTPRLAGYTFSPPSRQVTISNAPVPGTGFTATRPPAPPNPNEGFKMWLPVVQQ